MHGGERGATSLDSGMVRESSVPTFTKGEIIMSDTFMEFIDAILHQSFFDIKDGSIVRLDYIRVFSDGAWYRSEKHAFELPAFHQRKTIIRKDGTECDIDVIWIWSSNAIFGKNGDAFVPVVESQDVHDIFRHSNQDNLDFTTVTRVWRYPLHEGDPNKGEFFKIVGKDFPIADDEGESFSIGEAEMRRIVSY